jgi:hypothetical protein
MRAEGILWILKNVGNHVNTLKGLSLRIGSQILVGQTARRGAHNFDTLFRARVISPQYERQGFSPEYFFRAH